MLQLLPYHHRTAEYFKAQRTVWDFFANHKHKDEQLREFKTDLLKHTYKFDQSTDGNLYDKAKKALEGLKLSISVFLYQAQNSEEMNATVIYLDGEAHIVFSGRILELLNDDEQQAVIAHELSHILLYTQLDGDCEVADRIITSIANHAGSTPAHYETARLFKLYTEIFCDRGAYLVTGNYNSIISSLVKIATGLQTVNADSYIKQAEEIFSSDSQTQAFGVSHPENFIRARALWLWHSKGNEMEPQVQQMIEGQTNFEVLDIFKQQQLTQVTRQLIQLIFHPEWMKTPNTISLCKQYFGDIMLNETIDKAKLTVQTESLHDNLQDYLSYVLYDFATTDKLLEDVPLGYCFYLADELRIDKAFARAVKKENRLTEKKVNALKKKSLAAFHHQSSTIL